MTINTPVKIVVAFVVIALIVVMFWLFDWKEKTELVEQNNAKVAELEVKLEEQRKLVPDLPALTKEKTELEAELARVVQTNLVPEKAELFVANYIKEIEKLTDEEGYRTGDDSFEIISITPGAMTSQAAKGSDADNTEAAGRRFYHRHQRRFHPAVHRPGLGLLPQPHHRLCVPELQPHPPAKYYL